MKKTTIVLVTFLVGCAGTETRQYGGPSYQIKDGFLQPVYPESPANQIPPPETTSAKRPTEMPIRIPKAPESATAPSASELTLVKRTSKRIQEQVKRIRKILEEKPWKYPATIG